MLGAFLEVLPETTQEGWFFTWGERLGAWLPHS